MGNGLPGIVHAKQIDPRALTATERSSDVPGLRWRKPKEAFCDYDFILQPYLSLTLAKSG